MSRGRRVRIGVALDRESAVAAWRTASGPRTVRVAAELPPESQDMTAALATTLRALATKLSEVSGRPTDGARVHIALLPPLVDVRLVPLPPLRAAETLGVLRRDAARHFVGGASPRVVAATPRRHGSSGPVLAAAAAADVVEAVRTAAAHAGWHTQRIVPAHAAWLAAGAGDGLLVAVHGDTAHVIRRENGAATVMRRLPAHDTAGVLAAAGSGPGRAVVLAEPAIRAELVRSLPAGGWTLEDAGGTAVELAALHAADATLELVPESLAIERGVRDRRTALRVAAAAALLVVSAAGLELWGAHRELDALRARRADIRAEVAPLLATRDSLDRLHQRIREIDALAGAAPRWTHALFDLAMLLPPDAHITALNASGDTLEVEAAGSRAGAALQALRDAGSLRDVRLLGSVQRELEDGSTSVERFRLTARIAPVNTASSSGPPGSDGTGPQAVREVAARRTP